MTKVLVVEDSSAVGPMLEKVLTRAGYESRWVASGADAVAAAKEEGAEIVLLDMNLPDGTGLEIRKKLKAIKTMAKAKYVGLSGDDLPASDRKTLDGFLLKPVAFPDLLKTVKELVG